MEPKSALAETSNTYSVLKVEIPPTDRVLDNVVAPVTSRVLDRAVFPSTLRKPSVSILTSLNAVFTVELPTVILVAVDITLLPTDIAIVLTVDMPVLNDIASMFADDIELAIFMIVELAIVIAGKED